MHPLQENFKISSIKTPPELPFFVKYAAIFNDIAPWQLFFCSGMWTRSQERISEAASYCVALSSEPWFCLSVRHHFWRMSGKALPHHLLSLSLLFNWLYPKETWGACMQSSCFIIELACTMPTDVWQSSWKVNTFILLLAED